MLQTKLLSPLAPAWRGSPAQASEPFILFDDARAGGRGRLYYGPRHIWETRTHAQVLPLLDAFQGAKGHVAGFLGYDAGHELERKLAPLGCDPGAEEPPLLWFGLFDHVETLDTSTFLPPPEGAYAGTPRPTVAREVHEARVERAIEHIRAGDIYQANLTFPAAVPVAGDPRALFAALRQRQRAAYGALVWTGQHWLLSLSPELFFTLDGAQVTARPMKGTATRGRTPKEDEAAIRNLAADPKQRAENLMIVDLLRNDLSRLAKTGSVAVPELFTVETYPSVHQMTSTVTAELEDGLRALDLLRTIFPCGSITGAPKIRAMEIIHGLEARSRGPYCGSIGWIDPDGGASFNVAIRTLLWRSGDAHATLGLGSGIVADSRPADEWRECLAKGAFVIDPARRFDLIETMRFCPEQGLPDLERHLERLKRSADALGFAFDRHNARNELQAATFGAGASMVRLLLSQGGAVAVELRPLPPAPVAPVDVAIASLPVHRSDFRLRHKTTDRAFYDAPRRDSGCFEVLFTDNSGFLTEGSFTHLFVDEGGTLLTPRLERGLLPGILRERLLEEGRAREVDLRPEDLHGCDVFIGNAVRGLIPARVQMSSSTSV